MAGFNDAGKLRYMLDMKLSVGQVLSGVFATVTTVTATMIYVQSTYETKADSLQKHAQSQEQIREIKTGQESQAKLQTEIYGDVKKISGILESQMAEKIGRTRGR